MSDPINDRTKPPCVVLLHSGLCNQMFKVAAAYTHAKRNGYRLVFTVCKPSYNRNLLRYLKQLEPCIEEPVSGLPSWSQPSFSYTPIPPESQELGGYYQTAKYFDDMRDEVCALFELDPAIQERIDRNHNLLPINFQQGIAIHVRRGDYVKSTIHGILTLEYYEKAVAAARDRLGDSTAPLFVFSDDLAWCRAQAVFAGATFVQEPVDFAALYLMSRFQTIIIANSTFSWWAAYMGPRAKTVIAPDQWFGPPGPQDYQDIYLPAWIRVPC